MSDEQRTTPQVGEEAEQKSNGVHQDGKVADGAPQTTTADQGEITEGADTAGVVTTERRAVLQHLSEHEHSEDEEDPVPQDPIEADEDLLDDYEPDTDVRFTLSNNQLPCAGSNKKPRKLI